MSTLLEKALKKYDIKSTENFDQQKIANLIARYKIDEFDQCAIDPIYFISNYCYVPHQSKGEILMGDYLYDKQKEFIATMNSKDSKKRLIITNKTRQCGFSTALGLYALWYALFHRNRNIVIISISDKHSKNFLAQYVHYPYKMLPEWLTNNDGSRSFYSNMHELQVYTGSTISCQSGPNAGRGMANSMVIVDEVGFYQESVIQSQWSAIYPTTVTGGGKIVLNSTSSSAGTWYHDMWVKSLRGETDFFPLEVDWWEVPHLAADKNYAENMRRNLTPETKFLREVLREFVVDEAPFIPRQKTESMREDPPIRADFLRAENVIPPDHPNSIELAADGYDFHKNYIKGLWIWKEPTSKHKYSLAADVAEGNGSDYSTIQVIDINTLEQVAEFQSKIDTYKFATVIMKVAMFYNNAFVIVEANSMGNSVVSRIVNDFKYENLYHRPMAKGEIAPGFKTTTGNRSEILNAYYKALVQDGYKTYSSRLKRETRSLVTINNKVQGAQGTNDDLIMAFAINTYLLSEQVVLQHFYDIHTEKELSDEDILNQSPEEIKEYIERVTEYDVDNSSFYQHRWMY